MASFVRRAPFSPLPHPPHRNTHCSRKHTQDVCICIMPGKEVKKATQPVKAASPYKTPAVASHFAARPKNFGIGQDVPYARDLSRFMRWPTFVTMQRKKRVLQRRLKVPPALNQFTKVLDRASRNETLKLIKKYAPETRKARRERLHKVAEEKKENPKKTVSTKAPLAVVTGLQEVTRAIEKKQARMVVIANNVDPVELVLWMPNLCRANKIPYAIVKDMARLGDAIGRKTATCVAITDVNAEDEATLKNLIRSVNARFLSRSDVIRRQWGGLQLSLRSRAELRKKHARNAGVDAAAIVQ
ncbi:putative 60S ribosomal protein L7a [Leishmania mexicana MHOM/GT/2001/U1103]|uniref:60S ribosomal protein L7a n=2 Tax=Leishmania mexicana (strain MHOM/GT/2001/U1103) TaxID=929439 RepID=E9AL63_LEIMU|nr:putative 60S ribosomal protein L7a [Leishmania mexicana MHOM/GT/2001/U1103]CBZ23666.1 putative 60S ribosomal protein L7a [Leishmania mexicana MHOM/GT/2001/U1103]